MCKVGEGRGSRNCVVTAVETVAYMREGGAGRRNYTRGFGVRSVARGGFVTCMRLDVLWMLCYVWYVIHV